MKITVVSTAPSKWGDDGAVSLKLTNFYKDATYQYAFYKKGTASPDYSKLTPASNNTFLYESILQHEITHFKQKDHIWTSIKIFLCIIYWWNPFVWVASIYAGEDAELSCDARVLKGKSKEERKAYGYALLQLLENTQKNRKIMYAATSMSGSRKSMKRRIEEIANETKTGKTFLIISILFYTFLF